MLINLINAIIYWYGILQYKQNKYTDTPIQILDLCSAHHAGSTLITNCRPRKLHLTYVEWTI